MKQLRYFSTSLSFKSSKTQPFVTLKNGVKMPQIGLGTFESGNNDISLANLVEKAIVDNGYRHIDTAAMYKNEDQIGDGLTLAFKSVKREEIFVTTKLASVDKDNVEGAVRTSLNKLKLDYIDLYLIHWMLPKLDWNDSNKPIKNTPNHKVWSEMERLVQKGLIKSIGVCNCTTPMLVDIVSFANIMPVVNQIELHPYFSQPEVVDLNKKLGVQVIGYAPLGSPSYSHKSEDAKSVNILEDPTIQQLSSKYGRSPAQIVLNWHLYRGHGIIPKTQNPKRLKENLVVYDFQLEQLDYEKIDQLNRGLRGFNPKNFGQRGWNYIPYFE